MKALKIKISEIPNFSKILVRRGYSHKLKKYIDMVGRSTKTMDSQNEVREAHLPWLVD